MFVAVLGAWVRASVRLPASEPRVSQRHIARSLLLWHPGRPREVSTLRLSARAWPFLKRAAYGFDPALPATAPGCVWRLSRGHPTDRAPDRHPMAGDRWVRSNHR